MIAKDDVAELLRMTKAFFPNFRLINDDPQVTVNWYFKKLSFVKDPKILGAALDEWITHNNKAPGFSDLYQLIKKRTGGAPVQITGNERETSVKYNLMQSERGMEREKVGENGFVYTRSSYRIYDKVRKERVSKVDFLLHYLGDIEFAAMTRAWCEQHGVGQSAQSLARSVKDKGFPSGEWVKFLDECIELLPARRKGVL